MSRPEPIDVEVAEPKAATQTLVIERTIKAARDAVFRAWTESAQLLQWFGPEGFTVETAEIELKQNGRYKIVLKSPTGTFIEHAGVYKEIRAPEKLSFTWVLEDQVCEGGRNLCAETLVTLEFRALDPSTTHVVLKHELLPSERARAGHQFGWNSSFICLQNFIS